MSWVNSFQRRIAVGIALGSMIFLGASQGVPAGAQQPSAQPLPKPDSFLATNPSLAKTLAFVNDALVSKLRYIGQHNPAGKVLLGKSLLHVNDDPNRHHRQLVKVETPVLEDMSNGSAAPRSHLSVATALRDDLNVQGASFQGDYVLVPCKTGKHCVDNRLLLAGNHDQSPASLPGLGALMSTVWAPPSMLVIGPFPEGQAQSMVPVVQYLLSR